MKKIAAATLLYAAASTPALAAGDDAQALAEADALRQSIRSGIGRMSTLNLLETNGSFSLYGKLSHPRITGTEEFGSTRDAATYGLHGQFNSTQKTGIRFGWDRYISGEKAGDNIYSLTAVVKF